VFGEAVVVSSPAVSLIGPSDGSNYSKRSRQLKAGAYVDEQAKRGLLIAKKPHECTHASSQVRSCACTSGSEMPSSGWHAISSAGTGCGNSLTSSSSTR